MLRRILIGLLALAAAPVVVWVFLRVGFFTPLVNAALSREIPGAEGLQIRVGSFRTDLLHFIEADDVVVLSDLQGGQVPLLTLDNLRLEFELTQALRGRLDWQESLRLARLHGLKIFLLRESGGTWNLTPLKGLRGHRRPSKGGGLPMLPASRIELEDSEVVLNDEVRGFRATIDQLQGSLDTRALPLLAFNLNGRTDGHAQENLSLAGEWDQRDGTTYGRLNLDGVELSRYLNYFLPGKGLRFTAGTASLSVRLRKDGAGPLETSGRAELDGGALTLPGIQDPLSELQGAVVFDPKSLRFKDVHARFLGSVWQASGAILDLRHPRFDVTVRNPEVPMQALSAQVKGLGLLALSGTASVEARMTGPAKTFQVDAGLGVPTLGIAGVELKSVSVTVGLAGRELTVRRLSGSLWGGHVEGSARMALSKEGGLKADVTVDGARLEQARLHGRRPLPVDGSARLHLTAAGRLTSPDLDLDLDVAGARMGQLSLGGLHLHAALDAQGMESTFSSPAGRLDGALAFSRGPDAAFHDTHIALHQVDLSSTAQGLAGASDTVALPAAALAVVAKLPSHIGGIMDADFSVEGPLRSPTVWMKLRLPQGKLFTGDGPLALRNPKAGLDLRVNGFVGFHGGDLMLGRDLVPLKAFVGPPKLGLEFQALGRYPVVASGGPGHLALASDMDLRLLDSLALFKKSQGHLSSDLVLGGTLASPVAQGSLKCVDVSTEPEAYLAPIKNGQLMLLFRGQAIQVAELKFKSGGQVHANGMLNLSGGLGGLSGEVEVDTDDAGLRLENWTGMGSGSLVLAPLRVRLEGAGQPLDVSGNIQLKDALIVYGGKSQGAGEAPAPAATAAAAAPRRPLSLDLSVSLGSNVWYEKHQTKTVDLSDPRRWLTDTFESAKETLLQPDLSFRLQPTQHDFVVRGTAPNLELTGEVAVDRGRMTIMENDFEITNDKGPAILRFQGQRAEVSGTAQARMRYTRDDPITFRPRQKTVVVYVEISPRNQEELEEAGLEGQFLNYKVDFDSDPQIIVDNPDLQRTAVIDLVMLGDPLVDVGSQGSPAPAGGGSSAGEQGAMLASSGLSTVTSGFVRKELAELMRKFKFMGNSWVDVARLTPRIRYQTLGASSAAQPVGAAATQVQSSSSSQYDIDWTLELGKSIGDKLYSSLQFLTFGENARDSVVVANDASSTVQSYGVRAGVEYQVSAYRTFEVYGNFGCDDNLDPVSSNPTLPLQPPNVSVVVQLRNTIPTENYTLSVARRRRWEQAEEGSP